MKAQTFACLTLVAAVVVARAQGTLQYDQQSWPGPIPANILTEIQGNVPIGQSFVPALHSVGFVQFETFDGLPGNGSGATLLVNLRSDSMTGTILGSSATVSLPSDFGGVTNFLFPTAVAVAPGTTYFFEVLVQSGDRWTLNSLGGSTYPQGAAYLQGIAQPGENFWFREGVVVPEPAAAWLVLLGSGVWCYLRRRTT